MTLTPLSQMTPRHHWLKRTFECRDEELWLKLYTSMVGPDFGYALQVWFPIYIWFKEAKYPTAERLLCRERKKRFSC